MSQSYFWNRQAPAVVPADVNVPRTIAETETVTSRLMELLDSNLHGNVHGGVIMRMVDESAAVVAIRHCRRAVVTARIDQMNFIAPAFLGDLLTINCAMNYVGHTSMEIGVKVTAETPRTGEIRHICDCRLVFVALDEHRQPVQVPPLKATSEEERVKIERAKARRERLRQLEKELDNY